MPIESSMIGTIALWPLKHPPQGWVFCDGQKLSCNKYPAASSLLSEIYGGDKQTFNIPNLNGRVPVGTGQVNGGENYKLGSTGGVEKVLLRGNECGVRPHSHNASLEDPKFEVSVNGTVKQKVKIGVGMSMGDPVDSYLAKSGNKIFSDTATPNQYLAPAAVEIDAKINKIESGTIIIHENLRNEAITPHENRMPYIVLNYIIAVEGIFPILNQEITKE